MNTNTLREGKNLPEQEILSLSGVTLGYPGVFTLSQINLSITQGEFVGIIGPNGSGKSTLLKGILGLIKNMYGETKYFKQLDPRKPQVRKQIGYVPQKSKNDLTFPALVKEVVMMGLYSQIGWLHQVQKFHWEKVNNALSLVGMEQFAERPLKDLSGGQQQRVIIAQALVANPVLLMLDEPTAAVDIAAQQEILETLTYLNQKEKITILMITHDINEIVHLCHKILLLDGKIYFYGTPNEVLTKEKLKTVYGERIFVQSHHGHPHILVGDFYE